MFYNYADDLTLFVRDVSSVNRLQYILDEFEKNKWSEN